MRLTVSSKRHNIMKCFAASAMLSLVGVQSVVAMDYATAMKDGLSYDGITQQMLDNCIKKKEMNTGDGGHGWQQYDDGNTGEVLARTTRPIVGGIAARANFYFYPSKKQLVIKFKDIHTIVRLHTPSLVAGFDDVMNRCRAKWTQ